MPGKTHTAGRKTAVECGAMEMPLLMRHESLAIQSKFQVFLENKKILSATPRTTTLQMVYNTQLVSTLTHIAGKETTERAREKRREREPRKKTKVLGRREGMQKRDTACTH